MGEFQPDVQQHRWAPREHLLAPATAPKSSGEPMGIFITSGLSVAANNIPIDFPDDLGAVAGAKRGSRGAQRCYWTSAEIHP